MSKGNDLRLGVNIDHVATIRNARGGRHPEPLRAAQIASNAGADGITAHLREDRRHISDADIDILSETIVIYCYIAAYNYKKWVVVLHESYENFYIILFHIFLVLKLKYLYIWYIFHAIILYYDILTYQNQLQGEYRLLKNYILLY